MARKPSKAITVVFSFILLTALIGLGLLAWWSSITAPANPTVGQHQPVEFVIPSGQSASQVATRLTAAGLIKSPLPFKLIVRLDNVTIQAGKFQLSPDQTLAEIVNSLKSGKNDISVTLLEGWRREEMAAELERVLNSKGGSFDKNEFLTLTAGLEGQLYPDTYSFPASYSADQIVSILQDTFKVKVIAPYREQIQKSPYTLNQIITLASLLEREARQKKDRPVVAGIIIKRLENNWPLQIDASVQYALGYQADEKSWWKKSLTKQDLATDSPYNTYLKPGLPPAPIANPSLAAIKAVLNPTLTEYWFYLTGQDGQTYYATDLAGHNQNIQNHLH